jgi:hypothetical protein
MIRDKWVWLSTGRNIRTRIAIDVYPTTDSLTCTNRKCTVTESSLGLVKIINHL